MNKQYPHGKIHKNDDGQTQAKIGIAKNRVIMEFPTPTLWIGFTKEIARNLGNKLLELAEQLKEETK